MPHKSPLNPHILIFKVIGGILLRREAGERERARLLEFVKVCYNFFLIVTERNTTNPDLQPNGPHHTLNMVIWGLHREIEGSKPCQASELNPGARIQGNSIGVFPCIQFKRIVWFFIQWFLWIKLGITLWISFFIMRKTAIAGQTMSREYLGSLRENN